MATLTVTIPDAQATRLMNAVADTYGYIDPATGQPRVPGQTKAQFTKQVVIDFLKGVVKQTETRQAEAAARIAAAAAVDTEIGLS